MSVLTPCVELLGHKFEHFSKFSVDDGLERLQTTAICALIGGRRYTPCRSVGSEVSAQRTADKRQRRPALGEVRLRRRLSPYRPKQRMQLAPCGYQNTQHCESL